MDIVLFGGGVMPVRDVQVLKAPGVAAVFVQDTPTEETINWIRATHTQLPEQSAV